MTTKPAAPLSIVIRNLDQLVQDPSNPRTHDTRNLHAIRASLEEHGQVEPILVQRSTGMVIAGNGRMTAMRAIGWETAQVALLDVSDEQARRLSIALNRSGELAGWNEETLAIHLHELSKLADAFDPISLGFDLDEMEALVAAYVTDEGNTPAPPAAAAIAGEPPINPSSGVSSPSTKIVQLFLDEDTIADFRSAIQTLAAVHGTDNITDTVFKVVTEAAQLHGTE
jgi:hypothetical protein